MLKASRPSSPFDDPFRKGNANSGNHGHSGRPGQVGGSAPGGGQNAAVNPVIRAQTEHVMAQARAMDNKITPLIAMTVDTSGGQMIGLEHRIKTSADRISQKIAEKMATENLTPEQARNNIYDSLRFTASFSPDQYTAGVEKLLSNLKAQGIEAAPGKDKNYWPPPPGVYHGLNYVMTDKSGFKFELQFHTPESFAIKQQNHTVYEAFRNAGGSKEQRLQLWNEMNQRWAGVTVPPGVKRLGRSVNQEQA
jgi:hypothetical protein